MLFDGTSVQLLGAIGGPITLTGTLTETELAQILVPAVNVGPQSGLRLTTIWSLTNNANTKTVRGRFGGLAGQLMLSDARASVGSLGIINLLQNRGALNDQVVWLFSALGVNGGSPTFNTVDFSVDQPLIITGQLANIADTLTLESCWLELLNGLAP